MILEGPGTPRSNIEIQGRFLMKMGHTKPQKTHPSWHFFAVFFDYFFDVVSKWSPNLKNPQNMFVFLLNVGLILDTFSKEADTQNQHTVQ